MSAPEHVRFGGYRFDGCRAYGSIVASRRRDKYFPTLMTDN